LNPHTLKINRSDLKYFTSLVQNRHLAKSLSESISIGLTHPKIRLLIQDSVKKIFDNSLNAAIRDIENHPHGQLFQRLIEYGPLNPDEDDLSAYKENTILSDEECASAVNFIFSFIINRFKGELAELLSIQPCFTLFEELKKKNRVSKNAFICFGDYIQEYKKSKKDTTHISAKGADGLIAEKSNNGKSLTVRAIIEIKSMYVPAEKLLAQISKHISRLKWGLVLGEQNFTPQELDINNKNILRIMITPSSWKVNRKFSWEEKDGVRRMIFPEPDFPKEETKIEEINTNIYKITLNWSQEALEQAAFEMTFWYMSQVGKKVFENKPLPKNWEGMTAEEAGYNSIKEKLYYIMQPYHYKFAKLSKKQKLRKQRMVKLYNVYSFGYPIGVDSNEMLWPEDIK
jgi:hypothetical protein